MSKKQGHVLKPGHRVVGVRLTGVIIAEQVPPGSFAATEITISNNNVGFVRLIGTGDDPNLGGSYAANTEYWYAKSTSVVGMTSVAMTVATSAFTASQVDRFFNGYTFAFTEAQVVTPSMWTSGQYTPPTGTTARLFKATDPDDTSKQIGLVIAQDASNNLKATAWYKTSQPSGGWVWQPANMPASLSWTLVTDGGGNATLDPSYIQSGQSWYWIDQS
jgi:hypothetical protein